MEASRTKMAANTGTIVIKLYTRILDLKKYTSVPKVQNISKIHKDVKRIKFTKLQTKGKFKRLWYKSESCWNAYGL